MVAKKSRMPNFPPFINILGTPWKIIIRRLDDPFFKSQGNCGYCSNPEKLICILDLSTDPSVKDETDEFLINFAKLTLRHEIVHAYFYESGLGNDALVLNRAWCKNEELVDWIARQGPKIYKTWQEANCLDFMDPERYVEWKKHSMEE